MTVKLPTSGVIVDVDFDPEAVAQRYQAEREKRMKDETLEQFSGIGEIPALDDSDPYAAPLERGPVVEDLDALVLGGGFGGLLAGVHLVDNGLRDFRIIEQGGDFGGTWYWNRYPGVQCDVESYVYMPLLEETGFVPSKRYADGTEIFEHAQRIGRQYDLYSRALFQTSVTGVRWLAGEHRWEVRSDRGDVIKARFVLRANGPLNKPQLPRIPGIGDFKGKMFHTSRWDYDYTGGGPDGDLRNLRDKRVAIVGTGATGVQAIPFLAQDAQELFVVQRTPTVVGVRDNRPTDPEWARTLTPGWQNARHHNFLSWLNGHDVKEDLVDDLWTRLYPMLSGQHLVDVPVAELATEDQIALAGLADMSMMQANHAHIDAVIDDPVVAEGLKPWFGFVCKRPTFNDEYLQAFNLPSVTLLPAPTGIEQMTATGIVVAGEHHEVDCVIFATGFETGSTATARYGYDIVGRDGLSMREAFADGLQTLHGFFSHGFPNLIEVGLSQNAFRVNFTYMLDRKARHAARIVRHALDSGVATIEPEPAAQEEWVQATRASNVPRLAYFAACTPGYYNGQGDVSRGFFNDVQDVSEIDFWNMLDAWWDSKSFEGLVLTKSSGAGR